MGIFDSLLSAGSNVLNTASSNFSTGTNAAFQTVNKAVLNFQNAANSAGQEVNKAVQQVNLKDVAALHPAVMIGNLMSSFPSTQAQPTVSNPQAASQESDPDWYLTYSAVDQSGKQTSQTWQSTTGKQTAFAGIDAAGLSVYYAQKGNAQAAAMYGEIAEASKQNTVLSAQAGTKGTYYDIQPGLYGKSSEELTQIIKSQYPDTPAAVETDTAVTNDLSGNPVSQLAGGVVSFRDNLYKSDNIAANIGGLAVDVVAPVDLIDVTNLWMTGRGDQITGEKLLWAGLDALALVAVPFSFGGSLALRAGVKGVAKSLKTTGKVVGTVTKPVSFGGQLGVGGITAYKSLFGGA
jgi:hypothetical protein